MKKLLAISLLFIGLVSFSQKAGNALTESEKIFWLSKIWSEVNHNFANFDLANVNWDSAYLASIPKVIAAKNNEIYYQELCRLMALLKDGHSVVGYYKGYSLDKGTPPLRAALVDNKVIVTKIRNDSLKVYNQIEIGDEVLEVNNEKVKQYAQENIIPFISSSTTQYLDFSTYYSYIFSGKLDELLKLKLKKKDGRIIETAISRKMKPAVSKEYDSFDFKIINSNIGLLTIDGFQVDNYKAVFDSLYNRILPTKALIIDLRENGGGYEDQGAYVFSHFIDAPVLGTKSKTRQFISSFSEYFSQSWFSQDAGKLYPVDGKEKYRNPVVILTAAHTFSAAEDFLVWFDNAKRGIKIGQTTGGSSGGTIRIALPGDGWARITCTRDTYPDGKEFFGIGIKPDIEIKDTIKSIRENHDLAFEKAVEYLQLKLKQL